MSAVRHRFWDSVSRAAAFLLTAIAVVTSVGLSWRLGIEMYGEQPMAVMLGLSLLIIFLTHDVGGNTVATPGPVDVFLGLASMGVAIYIAIEYARLTTDLYHNPWEPLFVGGAIAALTLEGLRRSAGWPLVVIFALFLAYALAGHLIPGALQGRATSFFRLVPILGLDSTALFGAPIAVVGSIVIAFILMGQFLFATGGGEFFTDLSKALMGRHRGGAAKISVVASAFFGSISGSVVANITSTGIITIPMMKKAGFRPQVAGAVEAVASNGGQLMPPVMGAAAFLMADALGVGYAEIVIAAAIPALLYFFAVFVQIDLHAAQSGIARVEPGAIPRLGATLRQGWMFLIPFAILLTLMFKFNQAAETSALVAAASIGMLGFFRGYRGRRLRMRDVAQAFVATGMITVQILVICGVAGMIIGILNATGLGFALSLLLTQVGQSSLLLLLTLTALICIVLGMSMPTTSLYILLSALVVPSLTALGALPIAAHMFVLYFGMMSFVTPPVALGAFAAANIAGADPMRTGFAAMRLGWAAYITPYLFIYSPSLLMIGDPWSIVPSVATAMMGIVLITISIVGHWKAPLTVPGRLLALPIGVGLLLPVDMFVQAAVVNAICLVLAVSYVIVAWGWFPMLRKRTARGRA